MDRMNFIRVKPGETLNSIANDRHLTLAELLAINPQITNPNLIYPGDKVYIYIPGTGPMFYHEVKPGETLYQIANHYEEATVPLLLYWNPGITDPNLIYPGMGILIYQHA